MSGLFLSYSRADRALADQIIRGLRAVGVEVWWDEDMRGVDWQVELEHRIGALAAVMVIWTDQSINSNSVRDEARLGLESDKLVNVLCGIAKPPFPYDRINCLALDGWDGREAHRGWSRLVETVEELVVQNGGARPGDITAAQALREEELRRKQAAIATARETYLQADARFAEAVENAKAAAASMAKAEEQLRRVAGMDVTPLILRAAQHEFETARAAEDAAELARRAARGPQDEAARALTKARAEMETLLTAAIAPPSRPGRKAPARRARPAPHSKPEAEAAPATEAVIEAPPPPEPRVSPAPAVKIAAPLAPPSAQTGPTPPPKRASNRLNSPTGRWVVIAGGLGVVLAVAVLMVGHHGPRAGAGTAMSNLVTAPPSTQAAARETAFEPASAIVGRWAMQGDTCDNPVTLTVNSGSLLWTQAGNTIVATIEPSGQPGVIHAKSKDGAFSYTLHGALSLTMAAPGGAPMTMTKCAG